MGEVEMGLNLLHLTLFKAATDLESAMIPGNLLGPDLYIPCWAFLNERRTRERGPLIAGEPPNTQTEAMPVKCFSLIWIPFRNGRPQKQAVQATL